MRRTARSLLATAAATALLAAAIVWAVSPLAAPVDAPGAVGGDGVREIPVRVHAWGLRPSVIRVAPGQRVRFVAVTDDVMHGFAINELGVNLALAPGRTSRSADVEVTLAEGTYPIHCSVFCGLGHGAMKGHLVVGAPPPDPKRRAPWIATALTVALAALVGVVGRRR
jgi:heme/copper-type cytochrome/quinol oxidase subunit 2